MRSREHARAAGDRAAVAAGLADDGRGLAGDGRLVDGRDALDRRCRRRGSARRPRRRRRRRGPARTPACVAPSRSLAVVSLRIARSVAACALPRPSAIASAKLPKSTVSHSQTATVKANQPGWPGSPTIHRHRREQRADLDDEHDRVADHLARVELAQRRRQRRPQDAPASTASVGAVGHRDASRSRARLSSSTLIDCSPASPNSGRLAWSSISASTRARSRPRSRGDPVGLDARVGLGDVGVDAGGRRGRRVGRDARRGQAGRVGPLALQVGVDVALELVGEVPLVGALVVEERRRRGVPRRRRPALEVRRVLGEVLADQPASRRPCRRARPSTRRPGRGRRPG